MTRRESLFVINLPAPACEENYEAVITITFTATFATCRQERRDEGPTLL